MKCKTCDIDYPDEIISADMCGICALEWTNKVHGINGTKLEMKKFSGEFAEYFRQKAIEYRKVLDK